MAKRKEEKAVQEKVEQRRLMIKLAQNVAQRWLKEHPEKLHQHFSVSYLSIMKEAFPCNKQDKK